MESTTVGKKKFYKRWWFWVLIVIFVFILIGSAGSSKTSNHVGTTNSNVTNNPSVAPTPEQVIEISAVTLSEEYDANKVAADSKYEGKLLEISGIVNDIGKDITDTPYVTLKGRSNSLFGIQCMFSRADEPQLATLSKGQSIKLEGKVSGEIIGSVIVRGCKIVN